MSGLDDPKIKSVSEENFTHFVTLCITDCKKFSR